MTIASPSPSTSTSTRGALPKRASRLLMLELDADGVRGGLAGVAHLVHDGFAPHHAAKLAVVLRHLAVRESLLLDAVVGEVDGEAVGVAVLGLELAGGHLGLDHAHEGV